MTIEFEGVEIECFGHASLMLKHKGVIIYVDPYILPDNPGKADIVIFTHTHFDHCADPSRIIKEGTLLVGSNCKYAQRNVEPGSVLDIDRIKLNFVDAYNPTKPFHPKGSGVGVIIDFNGVKVYIAGDTEFIPEMKNYKCDAAILPAGGHFTMDPDQVFKAVELIKPKLVIPIHYGTRFEDGVTLPYGKLEMGKLKKRIESIGIKCEIPY